MTVTAPPAPDTTAPPVDTGCGDDGHHNPAPLATMLAVLGRIASHAGGVHVIGITEPGQRVVVEVAGTEHYGAWVRELAADTLVCGTTTPFECDACLHGWSLTVRRVEP